MGAHGRQRRIEAGRQQRPHLRPAPLPPASPRTAWRSRARSAVARRVEQDGGEPPVGAGGAAARSARRRAPRPVPRHTSQARAMRWPSLGCSRAAVCRIDIGQPGVQRRRRQSPPAAPRASRAGSRGRSRDIGQALGSGEPRNTAPCPPHRIGNAPRASRFRHRRQRRAAPPGHADRPRRRSHAIQHMRHARFVFRRRPRRQRREARGRSAWNRR